MRKLIVVFCIIAVLLISCSMPLSNPIIIPVTTVTTVPTSQAPVDVAEGIPTTVVNVTTTAYYLNIRASGAVLADKVGYLSKGAKVTIYECKSGWARISQDLKSPKWVNSSYLSESCK